MSNPSRVALVVSLALLALSAIFLSQRTRDILATASGWIVFLILLPVMIDLYKKRKRK